MTIKRSYNKKRFLRIIQITVFVGMLVFSYTILRVKFSSDLPEQSKLELNVNPVENYLPPPIGTRYTQRGQFWVLKNYIMATETFSENASITFTTHGEFSYLDNLVPVLERWNGPISMSVYSPGTDFVEALTRILYLRECSELSLLVKKFVSFHFYFENKYFPKLRIPKHPSLVDINCSSAPIYNNDLKTFRNSMNLTYPINIGRNVAREMATTNYVLAADVELYPSPNLIPTFLDMIRANSSFNSTVGNPKVFVLPIFEIENYITRLPDHKQELISLLNNRSALTFHHYVCDYCHKIPNYAQWTSAPVANTLDVFHTAKRKGFYAHWEPIFIAHNSVPFYDERLNREGLKDKMTQGFALCLLDYDFHILNNAFLIHRPGVKRKSNENPKSVPYIKKQNKVIEQHILPEIKRLFGNSLYCQA